MRTGEWVARKTCLFHLSAATLTAFAKTVRGPRMQRHLRLVEEQNRSPLAFREKSGQQQQQLQVPVGNTGYENLAPAVLLSQAGINGGRSRLLQHDIVEGREGFGHVVHDRTVAIVDVSLVLKVPEYGPGIVSKVPEPGLVAALRSMSLEPPQEERSRMIQAGKMKQPVQMPCVRVPPVEVQKETQAQLLRFAQIYRGNLFYLGVIQDRSVRPRIAENQGRPQSRPIATARLRMIRSFRPRERM